MIEYTLPYFGSLQTENLEENYYVNVEFNGDKIKLDLNFVTRTIDGSTLDKIKNFIDNIDKFNNLNHAIILSDYNDENGETVKFYLEHHLAEVPKDALSKLINFEDTTTAPVQQLLTKLKLVRLGLYPQSGGCFAVFDYSIGNQITDYLVVLKTDEDGKLDYMTMES
jgi:5S rRNA maturation endonuclease (ribonuclease M5)